MSQAYPAIEHIVVDGGSQDGTIELLSDSDATWISEPDDGQSDAINKGWRMSSGHILGWLNADDELAPHAIEKIVEAFRSDPEVGFVYGDVETLERGRSYIRRGSDISDEKAWAARNLASQPGSFNARWALEKVGYLDTTFHYMMDLDLWLRLIDTGVVGRYLPETLATFEVHGDSKSGSVPRSKFVAEEARARLRSGRSRTGSVAVGRAAALRSFEVGASFAGAVASILEEIEGSDVPATSVDRGLVRRGYAAEMFVAAARSRSLLSTARWLPTGWWIHGETRARVRDAAARASIGRASNRREAGK